MAEKLDPKETVSFEEALKMEIAINQALIDLLIEKNIITEKELMTKIQGIKLRERDYF